MVKDTLGSVIEFRLLGYFVYGVVSKVDGQGGDTVILFEPKFKEPIHSVDELRELPTRCKILFATSRAASKRNRDVIRIVGKISNSESLDDEKRFRVFIPPAPGTDKGKWQMIEVDGTRRGVASLSEEMALLSDASFPDLGVLQFYYDEDLFPWSAAMTSRGATDFDPVEFEARIRKNRSRQV
jgi:hypothetical protein